MMKLPRNWPIFILFVILIFMVAILMSSKINFPQNQPGNTNKLKITASFYPMYFFASKIAGNSAEVINLTPAGTEPHSFEPTPQDLANISSSKVLVLNGGKLESWEDNIKNATTGTGIIIIKAAEGLITAPDPHVWLAPLLAKKEVEKIAQGIMTADPPNAVIYQSNAANLKSQLYQLDQEYKTGLTNCQQKDIVTSHAAFGYLAQSYDFNQVAITGLSPDEEPSPAKLAEIVKLVKDHHIKYIFFESLVSPKLAQTLAAETNTQTLVLDPIEGLTDEQIQQGQDYFTKMQANLQNLQKALECHP